MVQVSFGSRGMGWGGQGRQARTEKGWRGRHRSYCGTVPFSGGRVWADGSAGTVGCPKPASILPGVSQCWDSDTPLNPTGASPLGFSHGPTATGPVFIRSGCGKEMG